MTTLSRGGYIANTGGFCSMDEVPQVPAKSAWPGATKTEHERTGALGLQIRVPLQAFFIEAQQVAGLLVGHAAFADGGLDVFAQLCD